MDSVDYRGNEVEAGTNEGENTSNLNVKIAISIAKKWLIHIANLLALEIGKNTCSPTSIFNLTQERGFFLYSRDLVISNIEKKFGRMNLNPLPSPGLIWPLRQKLR